MRTPRVSLIVAASSNGVIGRAGGLPWRLPEDLRRFKALSLGKPVLMGRRTYESIGHALPGRRNLVLTRSADFAAPDIEVVGSWEEALAAARADPELVVIGGAEVYRLALPHADRIHLTRVHAEVDGDTFFPELDAGEWREVHREAHPADARHAHAMSFVELARRAEPKRGDGA